MNMRTRDNLVARGWGYLVVGILGLLCIYLLEVIEPLHVVLATGEVRMYLGLSDTIGHNRAWDWTIFSGASPLYFLVSLTAMAICMVVGGWAARRTNYGRIFGYIVFLILTTAAARELGDTVSDYIKSPSPWNLYQGRTHGERHEAGFIDFDKKVGMPDEKITAAACFILLLSARMPRSAVLALVLLIYYLFCQLALGMQWFVTQMASVFVGAVTAGGGLLALRGGVRWLERKSEETFLTVFWRSIHDISPGPAGDSRKRPGLSEDLWERISLRRALAKERFWRRVIQRDVLPILGAGDEAYRLDSKPQTKQGQDIRPSRFVRFLHAPGNGEIIVVKALQRFGGIFHRSGRVSRYSRSAKSNLKLARLGLPVPQILWVEDGVKTFGLRNYFLSLEEFVEGRHVNSAAPGETRRCMVLLADLHAHTGDRWGFVSDHRRRSRSQYVLQHLRPAVLHSMGKIRRTLMVEFSEDEVNHIWSLFERAALAVLSDPDVSFRLTHGDVTARNFVVALDGAIRMIDFVGVRYDLAASDIIKACISLTDGGQEACAAAWRAYFEEAGATRWEEFRKEGCVALAAYALRELAQGRAGAARLTSSAAHDAVLRWLKRMFSLGPEVWGSSPEKIDWERILDVLRGPEGP